MNEWLSPATAFLWRESRQLRRGSIDDRDQIAGDDSWCEVRIIVVGEGFNDVKIRPSVN